MPRQPLRPTADEIVKQYETSWHDYENSRDTGNPLALDECVIECYKTGRPLPRWALPELAQRSHRRIEIARRQFEKLKRRRQTPFVAQMLDPKDVKSDTGGVGRSYLKYHDKRELVLAVDTARYAGLTADEAIAVAQEYLNANGYEYELESIKRRYWELRRKFTAGEFAWDANLNLMLTIIHEKFPPAKRGKKPRGVSGGMIR